MHMPKSRPAPDKTLHAMDNVSRRTSRGHLKIFFGYAPGVGKTRAMLWAAHAAKERGVDVVVGCVRPNEQPQVMEMLGGLEQLPGLRVGQGTVQEFDIDAAIARRPQLILVGELAHSNAEGCRHTRRYQDVEELLKAGIDVYTTVNVQNIESLTDVVASITGVAARERIPDSVFDSADQVELLDIEPQDLLEQMQLAGVQSHTSGMTLEKLTALREIALRRCADRVNLLTENARVKNQGAYLTDEHILVCLSSAPSNAKIIRTAARMASAFRGTFTALYVETPDLTAMSGSDRERLRSNIRLAQQLGAAVETVYGDDVPQQIADFARMAGVSKIVLGRNTVTRRHFFSKPTLVERLIAVAPNLDVYVIPDSAAAVERYHAAKLKNKHTAFSAADILKSTGILAAASLIGFLFEWLGFTEVNIITVYILGVLITSVVVKNQIYSLISSALSVLVFNYLFTEPHYSLFAYESGYPVTFVITFAAAMITGTLAVRLKNNAKQSARSAFRTKILFDANQLLQQAGDRKKIDEATASQLVKLLGRSVIIYPVGDGTLGEPYILPAPDRQVPATIASGSERAVAEWVLKNNKHAGATTDTHSSALCLYLSIRVNSNVYGVVGIVMDDGPLDAFENSVMLAILGESALAMENQKNAREKEEAAILAKNEQLRADLLRAISHDLRTPLTSISGNASNLLSNGEYFDAETKRRLYTDIYDDSMWLINLVENLLSVTRLEEGRMNLHISAELMEDVVAEALRHINRKSLEHEITVTHSDELLLAKMDARLIVQVIINLVDNAVKYTPKGSHISITTERRDGQAVVRIADDGPGVPDDKKTHIFDMFYSGANKVADSRRSLGLGLALCRSIVAAHGGEIGVSDNIPHGAVFTFTLPAQEARLHE